MICGRPRTLLCAAGIALLSFDPAAAQPAVAAQGEGVPVVPAGQPRAVLILRQVPTTAPPRQVPTGKPPRERPPDGKGPSLQQPRRTDDTRIVPQGFSVVLVLADLTASSAQDDVPPAARRALADLKDFLPYKSYKLLDAAWLLGQGQQTIRLRGPEEQQYELRLITPGYATSSRGLSVQFMLREAQTDPPLEALAAAQGSALERRQQLDRLQTELRQAREKRDQAKVREVEQQLAAARDQRVTAERKYRMAQTSANRPMIDTSFTMEVGETVVVGTSRLKGNSRALIALLTAVPPRSANPRVESR